MDLYLKSRNVMEGLENLCGENELRTCLSEALISERFLTELTGEAGGVPGRAEGPDNSAQDKLGAGGAAGGEEDLEVVPAVPPPSGLEELSAWEHSKPLQIRYFITFRIF